MRNKDAVNQSVSAIKTHTCFIATHCKTLPLKLKIYAPQQKTVVYHTNEFQIYYLDKMNVLYT